MLDVETLLQHRYCIVRELGRGGMGAVYEAIDQRFGSTVALKEIILDDEPMRQAFKREANLLNGLRHANLPYVMDYFAEGDGQFLVMQYIPGDDLASLLARAARPFDVDTVLDWADQLLGALEYLHGHEPPIVHRDIKPQNIKLTPRGEAILLDFGLAKGCAAHMTGGLAKSILGYTPHYAPFEQVRGKGTDARSDLYALAATIYHLLTCRMPPDAVRRCHALIELGEDPLRPASELNPAVPAPVASALHAALAFGIADRPASAAILRHALAVARATRWGESAPAAHTIRPLPSVATAPVRTTDLTVESKPRPNWIARVSLVANVALVAALGAVAVSSIELSLPAHDAASAASAAFGLAGASLPDAAPTPNQLAEPDALVASPVAPRENAAAPTPARAAAQHRAEPARLPAPATFHAGLAHAQNPLTRVDLTPAPVAEVNVATPPPPAAPDAPPREPRGASRRAGDGLASLESMLAAEPRTTTRSIMSDAAPIDRRRPTVERRAPGPPAQPSRPPSGGIGRRGRQ